jgi:hypothetical protein
VSGTYQTLVGNFGGDGAGDIFWYAPGTAPDSLWLGRAGVRGATGFTRIPQTVNGTDFVPIVADLAGDDHDDIFWYRKGAGADFLWVSDGDGTFTSRSMPVNGYYRPFRLEDFHVDAKDDLLWLATSTGNSVLAHFADTGTGAKTSQSLVNVYAPRFRPVVGDWNGDGREDFFLHGPGSEPDIRMLVNGAGAITRRYYTVGGTYQPFVVWGLPGDGILWWGGVKGTESFWTSDGFDFTTRFVRQASVDATATPYALDCDVVSGPTFDAGMFCGDTEGGEYYAITDDTHRKRGERPLVGDFDRDGRPDILWYAPGLAADELWYFDAPEPAAGRAAGGSFADRVRPDPRR